MGQSTTVGKARLAHLSADVDGESRFGPSDYASEVQAGRCDADRWYLPGTWSGGQCFAGGEQASDRHMVVLMRRAA